MLADQPHERIGIAAPGGGKIAVGLGHRLASGAVGWRRKPN
jgi:hypothetical protein